MSASAVVLDGAELAWAAGFFDGEGSTIARTFGKRPGYSQLNVTVPQAGHRGTPAVLERFQRVMLGMGHISGPYHRDGYMLRFNAREEANLDLQLLWPHLGEVKRAQATQAIARVEQRLASGTRERRKPRKSRPEPPAILEPSQLDLERAWAAGFLDAEGCFGLNRAKSRVRGPAWYRIRVSADQHGVVGATPEGLVRLRRALEDIGRIDCHGQPDDYKWMAEGPLMVARVLQLTSPWLGDEKREDAIQALATFGAQIRLRGDATRCVRGHLYSGVAMKGGRMRRICNTCERFADRAQRAAQGIPPRPFKNPARRYT